MSKRERQGISFRTAWRRFKAGTPRCRRSRQRRGTILVVKAAEALSRAAAVGVGSSDQKKDLEGQVGRLVAFANARGLAVSRAVSEKIGSRLNGRRPKLLKVLADPAVQTIVVEHGDRLMRFGCEYAEASLAVPAALEAK